MAEMAAFQTYAWCSRYRIKNHSDDNWVNHPVILTNIPIFQVDGQDIEVYLLLAISTKKGRITYDSKMIDYRLEHDIPLPGTAQVSIPSLQPGSSLLIDVFSYLKGA